MGLVVVVADEAKRWQTLLEAAEWSGEMLPVDVDQDITELADVVIDVVRSLGESAPEVAAVVGVGQGGRAAQLMALGGRTGRLVLVDGLTHRFADPNEVIGARMEWMRRRVAGELPPIPRVESRSFAERAAAGVAVPTLIVETPASHSTDEVVESVTSAFPAGNLVRVADDEEAAAQVASWLNQ